MPTNKQPEVSDTVNANSLKADREMTFGERLVGLTFNPSGDDKVATAKRLCAALADLVQEQSQERQRHWKTNFITTPLVKS
jgi:hypothetical protein